MGTLSLLPIGVKLPGIGKHSDLLSVKVLEPKGPIARFKNCYVVEALTSSTQVNSDISKNRVYSE